MQWRWVELGRGPHVVLGDALVEFAGEAANGAFVADVSLAEAGGLDDGAEGRSETGEGGERGFHGC